MHLEYNISYINILASFLKVFVKFKKDIEFVSNRGWYKRSMDLILYTDENETKIKLHIIISYRIVRIYIL